MKAACGVLGCGKAQEKSKLTRKKKQIQQTLILKVNNVRSKSYFKSSIGEDYVAKFEEYI